MISKRNFLSAFLLLPAIALIGKVSKPGPTVVVESRHGLKSDTIGIVVEENPALVRVTNDTGRPIDFHVAWEQGQVPRSYLL